LTEAEKVRQEAMWSWLGGDVRWMA
jgi:hypothetical protein